MTTNSQVPFGNIPLGRSVEESSVAALPSGREVALITTRLSLEQPPGVWRTVAEMRAEPPLNCSCVPQTVDEIRECMLCLAVFCSSLG